MNIAFDVRYYNEIHKNHLAGQSFSSALDALVVSGLEVPTMEFWAYALFNEQNGRFHTYNQISQRLPKILAHYEDFFDSSTGTLIARDDDSNERPVGITEAAGVGASLSLTSHLFGLTEADWEKIPISSQRDMDFNIASDGGRYIELEAKGSVVNDVNRKSSTISQHAKDIGLKKATQRSAGNRSTLIGVIAAFPKPSSPVQRARCWVLDPPGHKLEMDPFKYRVLSRMRFYLREIGLVAPRAHFLYALSNRLSDMILVVIFVYSISSLY